MSFGTGRLRRMERVARGEREAEVVLSDDEAGLWGWMDEYADPCGGCEEAWMDECARCRECRGRGERFSVRFIEAVRMGG